MINNRAHKTLFSISLSKKPVAHIYGCNHSGQLCEQCTANRMTYPPKTNGTKIYRQHIESCFGAALRSEERTSELQSRPHLVCRLLLEKKKKTKNNTTTS